MVVQTSGGSDADDVALEAGLDTFFVSLTFEDYGTAEAAACLAALAKDARVTALVGALHRLAAHALHRRSGVVPYISSVTFGPQTSALE